MPVWIKSETEDLNQQQVPPVQKTDVSWSKNKACPTNDPDNEEFPKKQQEVGHFI